MPQISETNSRSFVNGLELGFPPETDCKLFEKMCPELANISPESPRAERQIAFDRLHKRLGLRVIRVGPPEE